MPHRGMNIRRLHRIAAGAVDDVVDLRQFDQVAKVFLVTRTAPALHIRAIGRAGNLGKRQVLATNADIALGVARMEGEFAGAGLDAFQNQVPVQPHPVRTLAHIGPGLFEDGAGLRVHELNAQLFQHPQRGVVNRFQLVFRHHRRGWQPVGERAVFDGGTRGPNRPATPPRTPSGGTAAGCDFI